LIDRDNAIDNRIENGIDQALKPGFACLDLLFGFDPVGDIARYLAEPSNDPLRSMVLTLGRDFNPSWTLFGSYIYGYTDSNLIRFRKDDNRFLTSLVRNF
jgi:hypothetical protein